MSHYDDEAQVAELKQWWKENRAPLIAGLVLGLSGIAGWQFWQSYDARRAGEASQMFEDLKQVANQGKVGETRTLVEKLKSDYPRSPYAAGAALLSARLAADRQDWKIAHEELEWVSAHARDDGLRQIAQLRQARVLWQLGQPENALKLIPAKPEAGFAPLFEELRGDIKLAQGDRAAARDAYQKALPDAAASTRELIQRKLDDLAETPAAS